MIFYDFKILIIHKLTKIEPAKAKGSVIVQTFMFFLYNLLSKLSNFVAFLYKYLNTSSTIARLAGFDLTLKSDPSRI